MATSRAPVEAIEAYKARMGWSFDWISCGRTMFNQDLGAAAGAPYPDGVELHGLSAFAREGDDVFHTYSAFDRGTDVLNTVWQLLDRTPRGRGGEHPSWPRRRYEYVALEIVPRSRSLTPIDTTIPDSLQASPMARVASDGTVTACSSSR